MPNWTYNTIKVQGEKEQLAKMMNDAVKTEDGKLKLSSWFPVPESYNKYDTTNHPDGRGFEVGKEFYDGLGNRGIMTEELLEEYKRATAEQREKYGAVGWYDYNCKYLGCKWDMDFDSIDESEGEITLGIQTPWNAPDAWLIRMSKRYPELTFSNYADYEEGDWYNYTIKNGKETYCEHGETEYEEEEIEG